MNDDTRQKLLRIFADFARTEASLSFLLRIDEQRLLAAIAFAAHTDRVRFDFTHRDNDAGREAAAKMIAELRDEHDQPLHYYLPLEPTDPKAVLLEALAPTRHIGLRRFEISPLWFAARSVRRPHSLGHYGDSDKAAVRAFVTEHLGGWPAAFRAQPPHPRSAIATREDGSISGVFLARVAAPMAIVDAWIGLDSITAYDVLVASSKECKALGIETARFIIDPKVHENLTLRPDKIGKELPPACWYRLD